jgi:dienelactone hydrolase
LTVAGCGEASRSSPAPRFGEGGPPPAVRSGQSLRERGVRWLTFTSELGGRVPAYLVEPRGRGPFPAVVFQHGLRGNRAQFLGEARHLRAHGIESLLLDAPWARPHGPRILTGRATDATTLRQTVLDERRAVDVLRARREVDPSRIGVMGFSLGAVTSAVVARVDREVRCTVLASAGQRLAPLLQRFGGVRYLRAMSAFDPIRWLGHSTARVLLQNGMTDADFPPSDALAISRAGGVMYRAGHTLDPQAVADRERWLEGCLAK